MRAAGRQACHDLLPHPLQRGTLLAQCPRCVALGIVQNTEQKMLRSNRRVAKVDRL